MGERPNEGDEVRTLRGLGRVQRSPESFVRRISDPSFHASMRGYDRAGVDAYVEEVTRIVAELEARQSSEAVIKRALEDVGEQTSAILQKAHESAEEIARRSRAEADDWVQEAEREAERLRRETDEWLRNVEAKADALLAERRRLIEDMRSLAEEVLRVADDAIERLETEEAAARTVAGLAEEPTVEAEPTTQQEPWAQEEPVTPVEPEPPGEEREQEQQPPC
jgi:DivIVA domain-containing protein